MVGKLGVHIAIGKGYEQALADAKELGISCCQIFTHNPRGWSFAPLKEKEVADFAQKLQERGISPVVSHCNYLINLGSQDKEQRKKSLECLRKEFQYAKAFGCSYFVLHVGKYTKGTLQTGIELVAEGINEIKEEILDSGVELLLETVAGAGTEIGKDFRTLGEILGRLDPEIRDKTGICVDTCHIFAAGYDFTNIDKLVKDMDEGFDISNVKVLHLNDSKFPCGEHKDRHEHIGEGHIGREGFQRILQHKAFRSLPKILETPVDEDKGFKENLDIVRLLQ